MRRGSRPRLASAPSSRIDSATQVRPSFHIRAAALLLAATLALAGCGSSGSSGSNTAVGSKPPVSFGTKNFPEEFLLGELYTQALRAKGFNVSLKSDVGATEIIYRALTLGTLDAYPEYTGILNTVIGGNDSRQPSATEAYRQARQVAARSGIAMLNPTPFEDRDVLAVKPEFARRYKLTSIADLAKVPRTVRISGAPEFRTRVEGFIGLQTVYGLNRISFRSHRIGTQYAALDSGTVDAADVFTTDGQLSSSKYVVLKDPKNVFGFQNVAPLVRQKVLDAEGPEFAAVLNAVSAKLTTPAMQRMNAAVVLKKRPPAAVASEFLKANKLK